jgi:hypothetical protein
VLLLLLLLVFHIPSCCMLLLLLLVLLCSMLPVSWSWYPETCPVLPWWSILLIQLLWEENPVGLGSRDPAIPSRPSHAIGGEHTGTHAKF